MHPSKSTVEDPVASVKTGRRRLLTAAALAWFGPSGVRAQTRPLSVGVDANLALSGLAERLRLAVSRDTGMPMRFLPAPSAVLLDQLERGDLDVAIAHAPRIEAKLQRQNLVHDRQPVARTGLVLVGPKPGRRGGPDPAGLASQTDLAEALRRIATAGAQGQAAYVGAGPQTLGADLERALWDAVGVPHPPGAWWQADASGDPQRALALARERQAFTLIERGVWAARGARDGDGLQMIVPSDARLDFTYHAMRSFRVAHPAGKLFVAWLAGRRGARVVAAFGRGYGAPGR